MGIQRRQFLLFGGTAFLSIAASQRSWAKSVEDIRKLARLITVQVMTQGPSGTGVLIKQNEQVYTVLTAAHVMKNSNPGEEAYVITHDGETHALDTNLAQLGEKADIAIATFSSDQSYRTTEIGKFSNLDILDEIYVGGYTLTDPTRSKTIFTLTRGEVASIGRFADGYGFSYTAVTKTGMSGGPVLDRNGRLIGIHGRASGRREDGSVKGLNLGVPVGTAIKIFGLNGAYQPKTANQPPEPSPSDPPQQEEPPSDQEEPKPTPELARFNFIVLGVNDRGQVRRRKRLSAQYFRQPLKDNVTLDMVSIPSGEFAMGSPVTETHRQKNESPKHLVKVSSFFMGKYPITQAQWQAIMGNNPSKFQGDNHPVEQVSWFLAEEFCKKLSEATGQDYRLPSEAEWEYAARAGTTTPFHFGTTLTTDLANYDGNYAYGKGPKGAFKNSTTDVESLAGNAFGLFNMHGQVWEWCQDHWHETYKGAPTDGTAWVDQNDPKARRVRRGGSWYDGPHACRSAFRYRSYPYSYTNAFGLRVVCPALKPVS